MAQFSLFTRTFRPRKLTVIESGETFFGKHPVLAGYTISKTMPCLYALSYRVIQSACTILKPFAGDIFMRKVQFLMRANTVGSNHAVPWGHPSYSSDLVGARQRGREKRESKTGCAWPSLPNRKGDLSVKFRVLLYKQLIRPMTVYACPI
jgi:hypothetical protein